MSTHGSVIAVFVSLIALTLSAAVPSFAADAPEESPPSTSSDLELDEVLVKGQRAREQRPSWKDLQQPIDWLARLVGRFVVEGHVDLRGTGNTRDFLKVKGRTECVGFGIAPGVQCELKIRWPEKNGPGGEAIPGGVPNLNPAVSLFGYDPAANGIRFILVDSNGTAESAVGLMLTADIMQSRTPCRTFRGECERVMRITARPDLKTVEMQIDLEVDRQRALSYVFVMNRVPGAPSVVFGRKK